MTTPADTQPTSPGDFLNEIRSVLPRIASRDDGSLSALEKTGSLSRGGFDEQLFLLRTAGDKQRQKGPDGAPPRELLDLRPATGGRRWLLKNEETQLHGPGSRPRLLAPLGVRTVFQPPFSGSNSWHYPQIEGKGKHWRIDPEFTLDPNTGTMNICCVVHHVKGTTRTLGAIKQQYQVSPGYRRLRIVAAVDILFDMFAWLNDDDEPWSSAGCQARAMLRMPGQAEEPGPLHWAPEPILYEGFVQTPTHMTDTLQFAATIDSYENVPHSGIVEVCIQAGVFTNTEDKDHSGAGARAVIQIHSLAVEHIA